jgi:signal transduction histidine kinase/BarA-like signal transduction histidine kinase
MSLSDQPPGETVVLVDDSAANRRLVGAWLRYAGFKVAEAEDGTRGLELVSAVNPDLVVLDVNLPDLNGMEVCRRIKGDPTLSGLPVLHTSATSILVEDRIEALEGGADAYLVMPVPAGEFLAVVRSLLRLRRAEREAARARAEAEAANRAKSEFISRMSHEFRTPLNSILGFAQLLELDELSPDQQESVGHVLRAGRHLVDLVNEVLDISRIEAGRLALSMEAVDARAVITEALALLGPEAAHRSVQLRPPPPGDPVWVLADRQRLLQVLLNLVSNAVKYNRADGWVEVIATEAGERVRIEVGDSGIGIAPDAMPRLFQAFERLGAGATGVEGTGLGLALTRRLAEAMGGTVVAESKVGEGSLFRVDLTAVPAQSLDAAADGTDLREEEQEGPTLLYVEDNLANIRLVERILSSRPGIRLVTAMQGRLALDLARQHRPDLVLLDLHLPDLSGLEILQRLHGELDLAAPVVVLSADATHGQRHRLLEAGAAEYLTKPLDVRRFLEVVDSLLMGAAK